jgi:predicted aspartyl protease
VHGSVSRPDERPTYLKLRENNQEYYGLLDTGSEVTIVPAGITEQMTLEPSSQGLFAANGTAINVRGRVKIESLSDGASLPLYGLVSEQVAEIILGVDFLKMHNAIWDFDAGVIQLNGVKHVLHTRNAKSWCRRIVVGEDVNVPPLSEIVFSTYVSFNGNIGSTSNGCWATIPREPVPGVHVARTLIPSRAIDIPVRAVNVTDQSVTVPAKTVIAELDAVIPCGGVREEPGQVPEAERDQIICAMVNGTDDAVPQSVRQQLYDLLKENESAFSFSEFELGRTSLASHTIDTGGSRPVRQRLRRHPPATKK